VFGHLYVLLLYKNFARTRIFSRLCLLDAQTLLNRIALIPDIDVKTGEFGRPLEREGIDAWSRDPIDVVIENCL
jgi:hypothetical protein